MTYDFRIRVASKKPLYGHTSPQTAYLIEDYPAGFTARCRKRVWLEFKAKNGWRLVSQTTVKWYPGEEPDKDAELRWNKPDASTYNPVAGCMYLDAQDYVQWDGLGFNSTPARCKEFIQDYPQADFDGIKSFAAYNIKMLMGSLTGRTVVTINSQPKPYSDHELGEQRKNLEQWAEVGKMAGLTIPQQVKDLVDGTVQPTQFDPEAFAQRQKVRQEQVEAEKSKAAEAPGALNFFDFEQRIRSKVKLQGRSLVFEPGSGLRALITFHNIEGPPPSGRFGGNRQEYMITGFDRDRSLAVAKIKVDMEANSIRAGERTDDYSANMAAIKATALRGKTGTPEKVADYLAKHINGLIKDIPAAPAKTASYDRRFKRV